MFHYKAHNPKMHKVVKNHPMRKMVSKSMLHPHILVVFFMVSNASMYFSFSSGSMPFSLAKALLEVDMTNHKTLDHANIHKKKRTP